MPFTARTETATAIVDLMKERYWSHDLIRGRNVLHADYGYETYTEDEIRTALIALRSVTSRHIRFSPDAMIILRSRKVELLDYKVTRTPRYTLRNGQWDSGQMEADAWENYANLTKAGVKVAVLTYCPYHSRPLLCDYPHEEWLTQTRRAVQSSAGSGTDYVNVDLRRLRTFHGFMADEFDIPDAITTALLGEEFWITLRDDKPLEVQHDQKSTFHGCKTGFNWDAALCHGVSDRTP